MRNPGIKWLVLAMFVGVSQSFECREFDNCDCQHSVSNDFEVLCPKNENTTFTIKIRPEEAVQVECPQRSSWSEFDFGSTGPLQDVNRLTFIMCPLPEGSLKDVGHRVGVNTTRQLKFNSYDNLNSSLTRRHLSGFTEVTRLDLSMNYLTKIPADLFKDLPDLEMLLLTENNLVLPRGVFDGLDKLRILELGNNLMKDLDAEVFRNLTSLTFLNLWGNRFTVLNASVFDDLINLTSLDLNNNQLTTLPVNIFKALKNLDVLNIYRNKFSSLPDGLLRENVNLREFKLSQNRGNLTTLPKKFFGNLTKLELVQLTNNQLTRLPEDLFLGTSNLKNLSLDRNALVELPTRIFKDLKNLYLLDLSGNGLENISDGLFGSLRKLVTLNLRNNNIISISGMLFSGLSSLEELDLSYNRIVYTSPESFSHLGRLRIARLSHNFITFEDPSMTDPFENEYARLSPFNRVTNLRELYLDHNNISEIFPDWTVSQVHLNVLDLSWNQISYVSESDLQFLSDSINVNMTHNNISIIDLRNAELAPPMQSYPDSKNVRILLNDNPIECGCKLYGYLKYIEGRMHPNVQKAYRIEADQLTCAEPSWMKGALVSELNSKSLACYASISENENFNCPKKCGCRYRPDDETILVDCSYRNLTKAPDDLTRLPGANIELDLTGNFLKEMPSFNRSGYDQVTILILSHNNIRDFLLDVLPEKLRVLKLNHNNLTRVNAFVLEAMRNSTSLKNLSLHANPWKCDCEARDFLNFIQTKFEHIPELANITCSDAKRPLSDMTASDLCPIDVPMIVGISFSVAILGVVIGALAALYYRYQHQVKVWLYAHQTCLWLVTEEELDKDKEYDAFISYSHIDEDFVTNELVPKLEQGPRAFKLCLHYRDWLAGEWIPSQIARSVENSRRTIVVLSPNFLQSVWGRMEFRAAHSQAMSEGRARVIVLLYGDVGPIENLDPELKAYLSMNTYIKWGDPCFWRNLRFALPHPPQVARKTAKKIFENHQHHINFHGDKNQLIHTPGTPQTPQPTGTPPADTLKNFIPNEGGKSDSMILNCSMLDALESSETNNETNNETNSITANNQYMKNVINAQCTPA